MNHLFSEHLLLVPTLPSLGKHLSAVHYPCDECGYVCFVLSDHGRSCIYGAEGSGILNHFCKHLDPNHIVTSDLDGFPAFVDTFFIVELTLNGPYESVYSVVLIFDRGN